MSAVAQRTAPELVAVALRLAAFAALAGFCFGHYAILLEPSAGDEVVRLVFVATVGGAAFAASARLPGIAGTAARLALLVLLFAAALVAVGLEARLVFPGNWDEFGEGLDRGFAGLDSFNWPYEGDEPWVRLTILLALPLMAVSASALAFWPARRGGAVLRALALLPLLVAYGSGVTNLDLGGWALRGMALLLLVAAFLWLPRLAVRRREGLAALAAVAGCCVAALPFAAGLDAHDPWVDYRSWDWFSAPTDGTQFKWDHTYGPITWARSGIKLFEVRSDEPHYWKAESLTRFDGLRWIRIRTGFPGGPEREIPDPIRPAWNEQLRFTIGEFESSVVIGAGTTYRVDSDHSTAESPDGTVRILDSALREGDSYGVYSYVPDPSAEEMRAAPPRYPEAMLEYIRFDLPSPDQSGLDPPDLSAGNRAASFNAFTVAPDLANDPLDPDQVARVESSPYGRMFRLSRQLAAGQPTDYDVVKTIERHLQREYDYSEEPPTRKYPLPAFLFRDRIGYCQQFSGAMALMLRMNGIPARVATGFSPGSLNHVTERYEVRDFDAHSWVEVWFAGIGWVPFDPTPSQAPASSQSSADDRAPSAARGGAGDRGGTQQDQQDAAAGGSGGGGDGADRTAVALLGVALLLAVTLLSLWLAGILRPRRHYDNSPDGAVEELRAALERLGHRYPAGTTLAELERRLRVTGGDGAVRYVANLRRLRFAPPGSGHVPGARERRDLRRALTAGRGPLWRLRGLLALPPHPGRRTFRQANRAYG